MHVTVTLTVAAAGGLLPPMFVFKVKPGGHVQRELRNFPEGAIMCGWMKVSCFNGWTKFLAMVRDSAREYRAIPTSQFM